MSSEEAMRILNEVYNEAVYGTKNPKIKGTGTYHIRGEINNKKVCYTLNKTGHNGKWGFWSWIQTEYQNGKIKRTKFAKSGSRKKAFERADKLLGKLK